MKKIVLMMVTVLLVCSAGAQAVEMEWVIVGDAGNAADDTGYGAVDYVYRISKYEVTNSQYCEFLNAVAATDTYGLYNTNMDTSSHGGIIRNGSSGSYTYSVKAGWCNKPVNYVCWYDCLRFANWLHNGKPTGAQDSSTTEDGAYDMSLGSSVTRKPGAKVFLPTEDEWYKAAYYKPDGSGYSLFANGINTAPTAGVDTNYDHINTAPWNVGSGTEEQNGTFDIMGDLWEWNEVLISNLYRGNRGGSFIDDAANLEPRNRNFEESPNKEVFNIGFRLASAPEPPCWQEQTKLLASDGVMYDSFGVSVSISGNFAIVGADADDDKGDHSGSAYIFKWDGSGWVQQQKLSASDGAAVDSFGLSVSISGDYAIVGAEGDDDNGEHSGSAYIFKWDGTSWVEQQKLLASDGTADDRFGFSVSISGDYAIVGAYYDDNVNGTDSGLAYIFKWDGTSWVEQQKLLASDGAAGDRFGRPVSISGDYAIVGAIWDDDKGSRTGSAYIFKWDGTSWVQQQKLTASDGAAGDRFSYSVSISADYAIVGAEGDDDNGTGSGSAYIFKWDGTSWVEQQKLLASDGAAGDNVGQSVSISGDFVIVGAFLDDNFTGSAYIFKWDGTSWVEQQKLAASDGAASDGFGVSVSISGDYAIVGAYNDDDNGSDSGSAYVFENICNKAPSANAGDNIQILSADQAYTVVPGTAADPDGDPLEYRWLEDANVLLDWTTVEPDGNAPLDLNSLAPMAIGNHTLTLEVREVGGCGLAASDDMVLTVDNSPPEVQAAPKLQTVEIGIDPIIVVADAGDYDGDTLSYEWLKDTSILDSNTDDTIPGGNTVPIPDLSIPAGDARFPVDLHTIQLCVSDGVNDPVCDAVEVNVVDTTVPSLSPVPSVTILWPPNHTLVPVTIAANAFDNGGGAITLDTVIESSEPTNDTGDGNTEPDFYIDDVNDDTGVIELRLRAERTGKGDGRTYTVTITATDEVGNQSVAVVEIRAPHDRRKK